MQCHTLKSKLATLKAQRDSLPTPEVCHHAPQTFCESELTHGFCQAEEEPKTLQPDSCEGESEDGEAVSAEELDAQLADLKADLKKSAEAEDFAQCGNIKVRQVVCVVAGLKALMHLAVL